MSFDQIWSSAASSIITVSEKETFTRSRLSVQYEKLPIPLIHSSPRISLSTSVIDPITF